MNGIYCRLCQSTYDLQNKLPKVLDCGHTLCLSCCQLRQKTLTITCPFDSFIFQTHYQNLRSNLLLFDYIKNQTQIKNPSQPNQLSLNLAKELQVVESEGKKACSYEDWLRQQASEGNIEAKRQLEDYQILLQKSLVEENILVQETLVMMQLLFCSPYGSEEAKINKRNLQEFENSIREDYQNREDYMKIQRCSYEPRGTWKINNNPQFLLFKINKDCLFCGFEIFGSSSYEQKATITNIVLYQGDCQVQPEAILFACVDQIDNSFNYRNRVQRIQFNQKPIIKQHQIYTLSVQLTGEELFQADPSTFKLSIDYNDFNVQILETQSNQQKEKVSWRKEGPLTSLLIKEIQS